VLRDTFQLIITIFQVLDDIDSPLFGERVTILEILAKIESRVLMLDIGCSDFILEMFHIFLFIVSGDHPEYVLSSMQAIMTCILDESDDIPELLVSLILASLGREKEEISSARCRLAMNVVEQCANKIQLYVIISSGDSITWDEKADSRTVHEE
jgi:sister-chromatid-cohesion protein PDS5